MYDESNEFYTYVFVRTDLPLANQMVQACHACQEAGNKFPQPDQSSNLILFGVKSEEALLAAVQRVEMFGVQMHVFYEPDYPKGYTSACSAPIQGEMRRAFERFKLWR